METNTRSLLSNAFTESTENGHKYLTPKGTGLPTFRMVFMEGGEFMMGDDKSQFEEEKPAHKVKLNDFYMAEFQVSQELYLAVTGENPSGFKNAKKPVERVNWFEAIDFCNALNKKMGLEPVYQKTGNEQVEWPTGSKPGFRLPTEAEWEYAARGGKAKKTYDYAGSNNLSWVGWYNENSWGQSKKSGLKFPNAAGLYDMSGNLWEWCWDWYGKYDRNNKNPLGPNSGNSRVLRGGSWGLDAIFSRVLRRYRFDPRRGWDFYGFRLVLGF